MLEFLNKRDNWSFKVKFYYFHYLNFGGGGGWRRGVGRLESLHFPAFPGSLIWAPLAYKSKAAGDERFDKWDLGGL